MAVERAVGTRTSIVARPEKRIRLQVHLGVSITLFERVAGKEGQDLDSDALEVIRWRVTLCGVQNTGADVTSKDVGMVDGRLDSDRRRAERIGRAESDGEVQIVFAIGSENETGTGDIILVRKVLDVGIGVFLQLGNVSKEALSKGHDGRRAKSVRK
jgi:hypothetical protein